MSEIPLYVNQIFLNLISVLDERDGKESAREMKREGGNERERSFPLHQAVEEDDVIGLLSLLEDGADVNERNQVKREVLHPCKL